MVIKMEYKQKYELWKNEKTLDSNLKKELLQMNEAEIKEAFYNDLSFGTGGLRGIMGVGTNRVNLYTIRKATKGLSNYLKKNNSLQGVAIGYDNRHQSKAFAFEAARVLAYDGIKSYVYQSLRPTPMVSYAVRALKADAGIMITASHNPKAYNGYKVYNNKGAQVTLEEANAIIFEINQIENPFHIKTSENNLIEIIDSSIEVDYIDLVKNIRINQVDKKLKIVYSPLHGTGGEIIPRLLKDEGYDVYPLASQMIADPNFTHTKSSNPEDSIAFEEAIHYAKTIDAKLIFVTDPDADRLGVACYHQNKWHFLNGNQTAAITLYYILTQKSKKQSLPENSHVYSTIVTTDLLKRMTKSFKVGLIQTLTGFKFIGEQIELNKNEKTYLFGCEESYGSLIQSFVRDKDAVQAVYLLSEIACYLNMNHLTLIDYLDEIFKQFGYYLEFTRSITLEGLDGLNMIQMIMSHFREKGISFAQFASVKVDDYLNQVSTKEGYQQTIDLPKSNVLKFYDDEGNWIVLRPSGTEPKFKIYYSFKASSQDKARDKINIIDENILEVIRKIKEKKHV
jgi:phosphoglucomutase